MTVCVTQTTHVTARQYYLEFSKAYCFFVTFQSNPGSMQWEQISKDKIPVKYFEWELLF